MPENSGSRYKRPAFSLKLEKPENLSFLAQILFESSQTPRINRVKYGFHVVFLFHSFLVLTVGHRLCRGHQAKRTFGQQMKGPLWRIWRKRQFRTADNNRPNIHLQDRFCIVFGSFLIHFCFVFLHKFSVSVKIWQSGRKPNV